MGKLNAVITGVGGYVPDYILTNAELSRMVDTSDEWIFERTGIHGRYFCDPDKEENTNSLVYKLTKQSNLKAEKTANLVSMRVNFEGLIADLLLDIGGSD